MIIIYRKTKDYNKSYRCAILLFNINNLLDRVIYILMCNANGASMECNKVDKFYYLKFIFMRPLNIAEPQLRAIPIKAALNR